MVAIGLGVSTVVVAACYLTYLDSKRAAEWMSIQSGKDDSSDNGDGGGGGGWGTATGANRGQDVALSLTPHTSLTSLTPVGGSSGRLETASGGLAAPLLDRSAAAAATGTVIPVTPVVLTWQGIHVTVPRPGRTPLHILKGVSGVAGSGGPGLPSAPPPHSHSLPLSTGVDEVQAVHGAVQGSTGSHMEPAGSLFAILGPSGAGKSTLLDVLAGKRRGEGVRGEVRWNVNTQRESRMPVAMSVCLSALNLCV